MHPEPSAPESLPRFLGLQTPDTAPAHSSARAAASPEGSRVEALCWAGWPASAAPGLAPALGTAAAESSAQPEWAVRARPAAVPVAAADPAAGSAAGLGRPGEWRGFLATPLVTPPGARPPPELQKKKPGNEPRAPQPPARPPL